MTEEYRDALELYVSPGGTPGKADGTIGNPFPSLDDALVSISARSRLKESLPKKFEIVYTLRSQSAPKPRPPRHQFFVDAIPVSVSGDGTEVAPWPDITTAIIGITKLQHSGDLPLVEGDCLRLTRKEPFTPTSLERVKYRNEAIAKYVFMSMAVSLVIPVIAILTYLVVEAWPALSLSFVLENPINMGRAGGIWAPLVGTFMLVFTSLLIAAPIGVLAGVYLNEYAPDNWFTRIVNLAVVNLAGVPSIVHGLFGFGAFVLAAGIGKSVIAASCTLAVMTLPVVITSTREALASVPMAFREACWNMGASRWQTIRTIVLPNSVSGILTGVILQVSRVAGETAPILFTGAAAVVAVPESGFASYFPFGLFEPFVALSNHLFLVRTQISGVSEPMQFASAVVLIALVLIVNSLSIGLRSYLRSRKKW